MPGYTTTSSADKESSSYALRIPKRSNMETKSGPPSRALDDMYKKEDEKDEVGRRCRAFATAMDGAFMHGELHAST